MLVHTTKNNNYIYTYHAAAVTMLLWYPIPPNRIVTQHLMFQVSKGTV